jgi:hypothetical protein
MPQDTATETTRVTWPRTREVLADVTLVVTLLVLGGAVLDDVTLVVTVLVGRTVLVDVTLVVTDVRELTVGAAVELVVARVVDAGVELVAVVTVSDDVVPGAVDVVTGNPDVKALR